MKKYLAVYKGGSGEIIEKKSRFIAHVENVESVGEAQEFIELMKKEYWDKNECRAVMRTLQRGASNVYFAETESALTIPPHSGRLQQEIKNVLIIFHN